MRNHCKGKISDWDHFSKTSSPYLPFSQLFSRCVCLITNYQNHEQHKNAEKRMNRLQSISTWTLANSPFLLCIVVLLLRLLPHLIGCYFREFRRWKLPERFPIELSHQVHVVLGARLNLKTKLPIMLRRLQPRLIFWTSDPQKSRGPMLSAQPNRLTHGRTFSIVYFYFL